MEPAEFKRLVENIKTDGQPTSYPLAYLCDDGVLELISGHHRTEACIAVGLAEINVIVILSRISEDRLVALQLSHNSVTGKDNTSILAELYDSLDLDAKKFSGLTDEVLNLDKLNLTAISAAGVDYQELKIMFLPEEAEIFRAHIDRLAEKPPKSDILLAPLAHFDHLFDAIVRVKHELRVFNTGLAIATLAELAIERLDQLEAERAAAEEEPATKEPTA